MKFDKLLKAELIKQSANYYTDNFEYLGHGKHRSFKRKALNLGKRILFTPPVFKTLFSSDYFYKEIFLDKGFGMKKYLEKLDSFYDKLEDQKSKDLLVLIIAYHLMDYTKVKVPFHTPNYWNDLNDLIAKRDEANSIDLNFAPFKLHYYDLNNYGKDIKIYFSEIGGYTTFLRGHYKHIIDKDNYIGAAPGDTVLDLGGCFGDTALYFADEIGKEGKVYSFEFIPGSVQLFNRNLDLNPRLKDQIEIVDRPLWDKSGETIYYVDKGGGSKVSFKDFEGSEGTKQTISIDDFVKEYNVQKVDFIKTDIEGAEPYTINGAVETIKRFRPKMAISIYHGMDDFTGIIEQIDQMNLNYKYYLGHASIYAAETVLFCKPA
jgi:FkbM family methyltransferase